ncbi:MAG: hypothetical protein EOO45_07280 [Flavobacterium sp.]|nr:MAG: hypothetical protein EOO45_07280 [Flavobacterium sp.]
MKNRISLLMLSGVMALASCAEKKAMGEEGTATDSITTIETGDTTETDNTDVATEPIMRTVTGSVVSINQGKDGYTAEIKDARGVAYFATISIPNLDNAKQYRAVKVGDNITVTGEEWEMEGKKQIKATELK